MAQKKRLRMRALAVAGAVLALAAVAAPVASADRPLDRYVGLGDSFAAGSGVLPVTVRDVPLGCVQSAANFAHIVQAAVRFGSFTDESCGGAQTGDMTAPQGVTPGPNNPQFEALNADVDVVTLQIGGNDIGFGSIATSCLSISPFGSPCKAKFVQNGVDTLAQKINATESKIAATLQGIHSRSPQAKVFVVGYPKIVPRNAFGCWPQLPIAAGDAPYLDDVERNLNAMLKRAALNNDARFVDTYTPSQNFDSCKPPGLRWVEPLIPVGSFVPVHPNNIGELGMSREVLRAVNQALGS